VKLANGSKLSMIKKFSCGEILDKSNFMSVAFSCNFKKKLCLIFCFSLIQELDLNWKIELN
jgi:hypothetical protein